MKKSELNSSMLFKMRNGDLCVLLDEVDGGKVFCNKEDIEEGSSSLAVSLNDYDEELSPEDDDYDIVAIRQYGTCVSVVSDVLNNNKPKEWDWVEEEISVKVESEFPIVNNITINLNIDPNVNINDFVKQLSKKLEQNGINIGIC